MVNEKACALGTNRSCIRDLYEYGLQRAAVVGAENVFDYSLGNPSIPAPAEVGVALQDILQSENTLSVHGYTPATGDYGAREAIAADLQARFACGATAEDLFLCCGAAPGLVAVLRALAVPNAEVVAIAPYFPEYRPFAEEAGLHFRVAAADIPNFQIRMDALEDALCANTVAVIVNSPNNPSGAIYSRQTIQALATLLTEKSRQYGHPIYIIADEPYRELAYDGAEVPFIPNFYPDTVVCYSYSKSLSLPGERLGYLYVPKQCAEQNTLLAAIAGASRASGHVCAPSLFQKMIARCATVRPNLAEYDRNRKALYEGLLAAGYTVAKPDGAFYLFFRAPGGDAKAFSEKAKRKDLLVVPGDDFGCPGWLRVCYCVRYDTIVRSLPLFRELMD